MRGLGGDRVPGLNSAGAVDVAFLYEAAHRKVGGFCWAYVDRLWLAAEVLAGSRLLALLRCVLCVWASQLICIAGLRPGLVNHRLRPPLAASLRGKQVKIFMASRP